MGSVVAPSSIRAKSETQEESNAGFAAGGRRYRIGADIGGTFTDIVVAMVDGECFTRKVLSTPDDYARGIVETVVALLRDHGYASELCEELVHGTTVATNAILENKGAKTGLIATHGFRDVLEFRRLRVPMLYNLRFRPPKPIVERRLRREVVERVGAEGDIVTPLDETSVLRAIDFLGAEGVESIAVSLLHSYRRPEHEERIGELVRMRLPEVFLSVSSDILPEIREYERTSTTAINAYIGPIVRRYLNSLQDGLASAGMRGRLAIMQSSGGVMSAEAAMLKPASIVESGPAAGVIASQACGMQASIADLITFDMGGTTAKASLIENGQVNLTTEYEVGAGISVSSRLLKGGGHALKLPVLDIAEVGAGGGSVVWIDRGGALKVGPHSAGAVPGPACYDRGGTDPTVTDANLILGYLNPSQLAGGAIALNPERAHLALSPVAAQLGMGLAEAALGVYTVVNATMIRAIKAVSTYRGRDPRDFTLLAFGGSGPLHAAGMARALGIRRVIIPPLPGLFSAVGLLRASPEHHFVQTVIQNAESIDTATLNQVYRQLEERARNVLAAEGYATTSVSYRRQADLRYVGQAYELTVAVDADTLDREQIHAILESFGREHERVYGHRANDEPIEVVNVRIIARISTDTTGRFVTPERTTECLARQAYFGGTYHPTQVLSRAALHSEPRPGPFIVEDYDATTVVPPDCTAHLDEWGSIAIDVGDA